MMVNEIAALDQDEIARLDVLKSYDIAGTAPERQFDAIAELACELLGTEMAFVTLVERDRQWFKAHVGLAACETPRSSSFCSHTILSADVMVVEDTHLDPRFSNNPLVTGAPYMRFYAGAPLITKSGVRLGALCVIDTSPRRRFSKRQGKTLQSLASLAVEQMELRRAQFVQQSVAGFAGATEMALLSCDHRGLIDFVNPSAARMFGHEANDMIGKPIDIIVPDRMRDAHNAGVARVTAGAVSHLNGKTVELSALRRDGSEFPIELSISLWKTDRGIGMGAMIRDISERRERDARLLRLANHDTLTGLCNRQRFDALLRALYDAGTPAGVLMLDLDGFKHVNDSFGHAIGDMLLQAVALRLATILDKDAVLARFGGDEFAILLAGVTDVPELHRCAATILAAFDHPFNTDGQILQVGTSIGFAMSPGDGADAEELIASADFALYSAKEAGGRVCRQFKTRMRDASAKLRALQDELLRAMKNNEFVLYYQPQVSLPDRNIIGFEALLRWNHPERGILPPSAFLHALESSALASPVGWWVLSQACRQLAIWHAAGHGHLRIGVNLFASQLRTAAILQHVADAIATNGLLPHHLELEVTETIALNNDEHTLCVMRDLRHLGVRIAFDDFGTGFASLSSLQRFRLSTLKVDRSFIRDALSNPQDAAILRATISMGNELGLETLVEGIETEEQEALVRQVNCHSGQGYLYGRPVPADDALRQLQAPWQAVAVA